MQKEKLPCKKRLFLALECHASDSGLPTRGRIISEECRHLTLAFLGFCDYDRLSPLLPAIPPPPFSMGLVGYFDACLFLPSPQKPRVVAWQFHPLEREQQLRTYQKELCSWLTVRSFPCEEKRLWLPHVTVARAPFWPREWQKAFHHLFCYSKDMHLYESLGQMQYKPIHSWPLLAPFEEISHTADLAFLVRGSDFRQLHLHAFCAMAYHDCRLLAYLPTDSKVDSIADIVAQLNDVICRLDTSCGSPFKAVSYHDKVQRLENNVFEWEMIVDV